MNTEIAKEIAKFIVIAKFDEHGFIFGIDKTGGHQMIAEVRGWGAIKNLFKTQEEVTEFQDNLGRFIADAINEKIKTTQA